MATTLFFVPLLEFNSIQGDVYLIKETSTSLEKFYAELPAAIVLTGCFVVLDSSKQVTDKFSESCHVTCYIKRYQATQLTKRRKSRAQAIIGYFSFSFPELLEFSK